MFERGLVGAAWGAAFGGFGAVGSKGASALWAGVRGHAGPTFSGAVKHELADILKFRVTGGQLARPGSGVAQAARELAEPDVRSAARGARDNRAPPPCPKHSFAPNTPVLMADGSSKRIDQVQVGDRVLATDPETGKTKAQKVTALHVNRDTELVDLTVTTPEGATHVIKTTVHHPFWNETDDQWSDAADLEVDDELRTPDGRSVRVAAVREYVGAQEMRDLTVDETHTYYVSAGATPVLVHNCGTEGTATVYLYDPPRPTASGSSLVPGHASIRITHNGRTLHTERVGSLVEGEPVVVQRYAGGPEPSKVIEIPLPNARAAIEAQRAALAEPPSPLDRTLNNCVTHCVDILAAGGRVDAPTTAQEGVRWLYETIFR